MKRKNGFTLIELLVVVAIISVLISILLPSLSSAREAARKTVCMTFLKNLGMAISLYADASNDYFPGPISTGVGVPSTWKRIGPYGLAAPKFLITPGYFQVSDDKGWLCPSDRLSPNETYPCSYIDDAWGTGAGVFGYDGASKSLRFADIHGDVDSQRLVVGMATIDGSPNKTWLVQDMDYWNSYITSRLGVYPIHNGGRNLLWADQHVDWRRVLGESDPPYVVPK